MRRINSGQPQQQQHMDSSGHQGTKHQTDTTWAPDQRQATKAIRKSGPERAKAKTQGTNRQQTITGSTAINHGNRARAQQRAKAKAKASGTSGHQTRTGSMAASKGNQATADSCGHKQRKRHRPLVEARQAPDGHRINVAQPRQPSTGATAAKDTGKGKGPKWWQQWAKTHARATGHLRDPDVAPDQQRKAAATRQRDICRQRHKQRPLAPALDGLKQKQWAPAGTNRGNGSTLRNHCRINTEAAAGKGTAKTICTSGHKGS